MPRQCETRTHLSRAKQPRSPIVVVEDEEAQRVVRPGREEGRFTVSTRGVGCKFRFACWLGSLARSFACPIPSSPHSPLSLDPCSSLPSPPPPSFTIFFFTATSSSTPASATLEWIAEEIHVPRPSPPPPPPQPPRPPRTNSHKVNARHSGVAVAGTEGRVQPSVMKVPQEHIARLAARGDEHLAL